MSMLQTPKTEAAIAADRWNDRYPVGSPVLVVWMDRTVRTRTSSAAWTFNRRALISVRHVSGSVDLSCVRPRYECFIRMNRRGQKNHWLRTVWDSAAEARRACECASEGDPRIESFEIREDEPVDLTE